MAAACAAALSPAFLIGSRPLPAEEPVEEEPECIISEYDNIFRRIGAEQGVDWRLLSAMAYTESRFAADAVSPSGAVGLMQIMPYVARDFGASPEDLLDPEVNIDMAVRIMRSVEKMLRLPAGMAQHDRTALVLACYNGGYAHISDARSLACYYGDDPSSWESVAEYLELLGDEDFNNHEAVNFGGFGGFGETVAYVDKVLARYARYCRIAPEN